MTDAGELVFPAAEGSPQPRLHAQVELHAGRAIAGHVFDPEAPGRRWVLEVVVDGIVFDVLLADRFVDGLWREGRGDGCYGFWGRLPDGRPESTVDVRIANTRHSLRRFSLPTSDAGTAAVIGRVDWQGGLRLAGWIADAGETPWLRFAVDGECVMECAPNRWSHVPATGRNDAVPGFDVHLPRELADGRPKVVRVYSGEGAELRGSPLTLIAFADGLAQALGHPGDETGEQVRARLIDRVVPQSVPFAEYETWSRRFMQPRRPEGNRVPPAVLIVGSDAEALARTSTGLERQTSGGWVAGAVASDDGIRFEPDDVNAFLGQEALGHDIVLVMRVGVDLQPDALTRLGQALNGAPDAVLAYGDVTVTSQTGRLQPIAFGAFDYERLLEQGYFASVFAMRTKALRAALGRRAASLFALALAPFETTSPAEHLAVHVPGPVAHVPALDAADQLRDAVAGHLEGRGVRARLVPTRGRLFPSVRVRRAGVDEPVTLIVPTRNRADLLRACVTSLAPVLNSGEARLLVVDNDSDEAESLDYLAALRDGGATVLRVTGEFNFSRLNNRAVEVAGTERICLLNNDVEAMDGDWLAEMASRLQEPQVGAVGALLVWPSRVIQHGGVVLGQSFAAGHAHVGLVLGDPGYGDLLCAAHRCSAVTAACLMTRKSDYHAIGGLDETLFSVNFNDVDYCLRLGQHGLRTVMTPHARLIHNESSSRGPELTRPKSDRLRRELAALRLRWYEQLAADMLYSPMLGLDPDPYSALAWPPRDLTPRAWPSAPPAPRRDG